MPVKIFVANVPYHIKGTDICQLFEVFGQVDTAKIMTHLDTGKSKGFGFVEMPVEAEALRAIGMLHNRLINDRPMVVQRADEQATDGERARLRVKQSFR